MVDVSDFNVWRENRFEVVIAAAAANGQRAPRAAGVQAGAAEEVAVVDAVLAIAVDNDQRLSSQMLEKARIDFAESIATGEDALRLDAARSLNRVRNARANRISAQRLEQTPDETAFEELADRLFAEL